jgi:pantothenate kinase
VFYLRTETGSRLIIGLAGIPASGKSSLAKRIVDETNNILSSCAYQRAILIGLDGWHLSKAQLDAFPDAKLAHDRRGAHWTFDATAYIDFVRQLRLNVTEEASDGNEGDAMPIIPSPSFDHALKDPTPHAVLIEPHHRLVLIEGLYTFLSIEPWVQAAKMLDERWWLDVPADEAKRRLIRRHVLTGVAKNTQEAFWRAETNDIPSACLRRSISCEKS